MRIGASVTSSRLIRIRTTREAKRKHPPFAKGAKDVAPALGMSRGRGIQNAILVDLARAALSRRLGRLRSFGEDARE